MSRAPSFDRLARPYRWLEALTFGPMLQRCRCAFLEELHDCRNALVLGDGDGRFTARLLDSNRVVKVDAVDGSASMLRELTRNAGTDAARIRTHIADIRTWEPTSPAYDVIATHFFFDCLTTEEIAALAVRVRRCATPATGWLVSDFAVSQSLFGRLVARPIVAVLYLAFRLLTGLEVGSLPDHRRALGAAGFALVRQRRFLAGLLVSEIWKTISQTEH